MTKAIKVLNLNIFGDSISFGQLVSQHKTWAGRLALELENQFHPYAKFVVQNLGVNGHTTRQALERIHYDVTSHHPDFALVQFGMNDCNYWETDNGHPRVSEKAFIANIQEIIEKIIACGTHHCFLNTNHPSAKGYFKHTSKSYDESNSLYSTYIREAHTALIKKKLSVTLIDIEDSWNNHLRKNAECKLSDLLLPDGIHLSEKGHSLYKEIITPIVIKKLTGI